MHIFVATIIGFVLLSLFAVLGVRKHVAMLRFALLWLALCAAHTVFDVVVAGHEWGDEVRMHAVIFGLPGAVAWLIAHRYMRAGRA